MNKFIIIPFLLLLFFGCSGVREDTIIAPGVVEGEVVTIKSRIASSVKEIFVKEGDEVKIGDSLVGFDSRLIENKLKDIELNLDSVRVNVEKLKQKRILLNENIKYLKRQTARIDRLSRKKSVSGDEFEKIKLKLLETITASFELNKSIEDLRIKKSILENKREYLKISIEDYKLISGVNGFVMEKFVSRGENIFPGMPVVDILDVGSMYVEIFLEEKELFRISPGDNVNVLVDGIEGDGLKGVIAEIGKKAEFSPKYVISEVERKSLLYKVKIRVQNNRGVLKIGMPVTVEIKNIKKKQETIK